MSEWRKVELCRINGIQMIVIPPEFELPGEYGMMRKEGDRLIIEPIPEKIPLTAVLATLKPIEEEFPEIPDLPPDPVDL